MPVLAQRRCLSRTSGAIHNPSLREFMLDYAADTSVILSMSLALLLYVPKEGSFAHTSITSEGLRLQLPESRIRGSNHAYYRLTLNVCVSRHKQVYPESHAKSPPSKPKRLRSSIPRQPSVRRSPRFSSSIADIRRF